MINLYLNPSSDKLLPITSQTLQNKRVILFQKLGLYNQPIPDSFYNKSRPNFYPLQTWLNKVETLITYITTKSNENGSRLILLSGYKQTANLTVCYLTKMASEFGAQTNFDMWSQLSRVVSIILNLKKDSTLIACYSLEPNYLMKIVASLG